MTTLHLVNRAHPASDTLTACLAHCTAGDSVLLIGDGVYNAGAAVLDSLADVPNVTVYALSADVTARGLADRLAASVQCVDYDGFVALCAAHQPVITWF
jgi:tRNA 2-thiouridine synthesizing protein B